MIFAHGMCCSCLSGCAAALLPTYSSSPPVCVICLDPALGAFGCGYRARSRRPVVLLAREILFDMCSVKRAERRMSDRFTTAGSVGRSHLGDPLPRRTRMRRPCGSMLENWKLVGRWFSPQCQSVRARGAKVRSPTTSMRSS